MNRPISLAALTVLDLEPPALVTVAAQAGYDAVGIRLIPATETESRRPMLGDTPMVRETARRLADTGLRLLDVEILRLRPDTRVHAEFEAFLETGALLGASQALVSGNDDDRSRLADNLAELAELGEKYGIAPNLEPMPWTAVPDLGVAAEVLRGAGHRNVGLLIDTIHFARADERPETIAALPEEWFRYVQVCDAPAHRPDTEAELIRQAREDRLLPGHGELDLVGVLRALPADRPVVVEAPVAATASTPGADRAAAALNAVRLLLAVLDGDACRAG